MPKLPDLHLSEKAKDDSVYRCKLKCSVSASGDFRVEVPMDLKDVVVGFTTKNGGMYRSTWEIYCAKKYEKTDPIFVQARTLDGAFNIVRAAAQEFLQCEEVVERFIVYAVDVECSFWINPDGSIQPNGYNRAGSIGETGHWYERKTTNEQVHAARPISDAYTIGLAARAWDRRTYKRPSGSTHVWEPVHPDDRFAPSTPLGRLQSFCSIDITHQSRGAKLMPYSDAAAVWFHDAMLSLFRIAYGLDQFFGNEDNVLAIQEGRASNFIGLPAPQTRRQLQLQTPRA